jgi:hypothetical protein
VRQVEDVFQQAMGRCLQLQVEATVLPLSSGFDSRRILAALIHRKVDFQALTCRVFQKKDRDLDARFAHEMAREFGFSHAIVEPDSPEQYASDDCARRILVDAETVEHTWALRVMQALPRRPSLFFDGIAGDILGNPVGWSVHFGLAEGNRAPAAEIDGIADHCITNTIDSILRRGPWPEASEVREDLKAYLRPLLPRQNITEIAFLLFRQRRAVALWSQQLLPAGHVVVCPYLDLDYLRLLLDFSPEDKRTTWFQRACLREFWPAFYKYPGNRDVPSDLPEGSPRIRHDWTVSCHEQLQTEIEIHDGLRLLHSLTNVKGHLALMLSKVSRGMALRTSWFLHRLMELVSREVRRKACWHLESR